MANYAWVFNSCDTLPDDVSQVLWIVCNVWNKVKCNIEQREPTSWDDLLHLPLWSPSMVNQDWSEVGCKLITQQWIEQIGVMSLKDIVDQQGCVHHQEFFETQLSASNKRAILKPSSSVCIPTVSDEAAVEPIEIFVGEHELASGGTVWKIRLPAHERRCAWDSRIQNTMIV